MQGYQGMPPTPGMAPQVQTPQSRKCPECKRDMRVLRGGKRFEHYCEEDHISIEHDTGKVHFPRWHKEEDAAK